MKRIIVIAASVLLAGCFSSSGPVKTGPDTYYITKKDAGGGLVSGEGSKAKLLKEANAFCEQQGKQIQVVDAEAHRGIPFARIASAEVNFKCVSAAPN